jgi:hypothetical protein
MPVARVVTTKEIPYKTGVERFSNGYKFNLPAVTETVIHDLAAALIAMERPLHSNIVKFVYAVGGIDAPGAEAVYAENFATPLLGTLTASYQLHPEECIVYTLRRRQKVYARKWFHSQRCSKGGQMEYLDNTFRTTNNGALAKLTDGTLPGGVRTCWPDGEVMSGTFALDQFVRIRQFDRRGKRPTRAATP